MKGRDASLSLSCFIYLCSAPFESEISMSKEYKITAEGSLGVLALGDVGLKLWREQRSKEGKNPYDKVGEDKPNKENNGKEAGK